MHPRRIAHREAIASTRIVAAVGELAGRLGLETEGLEVSARPTDAAVDQMLRNEAAADLLEAMVAMGTPEEEIQASADEIVETTEALMLARIEAIDGIGPKTMEIIREGLAETSVKAKVDVTAEHVREAVKAKVDTAVEQTET